MSTPTKRNVVKAAMDLAESVAARDLDPDTLATIVANLDSAKQIADGGTGPDLDRFLVDSLTELFVAPTGPGHPMWSQQVAAAWEVVAQGGISPAELRQATALYDAQHGSWADVGDPGLPITRPDTTVPALSASLAADEPEEPPVSVPDPHATAQPDPAVEEIVEAELVELIEVSGNGQKRFRVPGGFNPRAASSFQQSISPRRPTTRISTDSPHLGDQR